MQYKFQMQAPMGARTIINGRERDYFAGCGYLGLQGHPAVIEAVKNTVQRYGVATGTARSRTGFGDSPVSHEFDRQAQRFFQSEKTLLFPSAYFAPSILIPGLQDRYDRIFMDQATHYSGYDGARISGKPLTHFQHLEPASLADACQRELKPGERPIVISDGIFPVSGAIAPADEYLKIVREYDGLVCLDDAHATGVLGKNGRGTLDYFQIEDSSRCYAGHTLSKALGCSGGLIALDAPLLEAINRQVRIHWGASAPPLIVVAAASRALELAYTHPEWRQQLVKNVTQARTGLQSLGLPVMLSPSPIISVVHQPGMDLERMQAELVKRDICIAYIDKYSDVPEGGALRIAVFSTHTPEQIDRLLSELGELL